MIERDAITPVPGERQTDVEQTSRSILWRRLDRPGHERHSFSFSTIVAPERVGGTLHTTASLVAWITWCSAIRNGEPSRRRSQAGSHASRSTSRFQQVWIVDGDSTTRNARR